ncbi:NAD-dependent epimerase/dehydratase family protein [Kitasatospora aureofaciens]|uniref:NAD-dependent epimerase/dehydratase family protein n=1 Tax=Kitasatospora aureofaciens TaxID=1894 RepID=UPI001C43C779|nr:NAD-dependent epimerase/dehydratase family protein [Kitasatospora aureofaciens]MBV6697399.1 NAD-dependent epimerase/dehydratase family protein [Kitasatospora aureofaciens]
MTAEPAYIVLGGAGRLGRHLLPKVRAQGCRVIGISRARPSEPAERYADWVRADLTETARWPHVQEALRTLLDGQEEVVIADLLLDRGSVTAMRHSIAAATRFIVRTCQMLAAEGLAVRVLAASTTAALAPRGLQTPYGVAKREQALIYSRLDCIDLVLLPQLVAVDQAASPSDGGATSGGICSYEAAAGALRAVSIQPARRTLWVVRGSVPYRPSPRGLAGLPSAVGALIASRTTGRDSPTAHRQASRERLALLPNHIRGRVDHHGAPEQLLRPFERRLHMPPARTVIAGSPPAPDHLEEDLAHRP